MQARVAPATVKKRLEGKNILITGGSTGIGKAIALKCAQEGANVAVNYLVEPDKAEQVGVEVMQACMAVREHGCKDMVVQADISNERSVDEMFAKILDDWGRIDVLVNNAGIQKPAASDQVDMADFDRVLNVNLRGAFLCSRAAIRHFLKAGGGVIVNNSSVHEIIPKPKYVAYSISKGGMGNLTRTLALEYAARNIRVNSVAPGAIETPINDAWTHDQKARALVESHIPMGRAGSSEEIAAVVAFLASDEASYITGQTLFACGGLTLYPEFRSAWSSGE
jgi:glucose 1-dehydrogenase